MSVDELLWVVLGDRLPAGDGGRPAPPSSWDDSSREAAVRVLDAGIAAMAATAHFAGVAEELLRDRRDRLAGGSGPDRTQTADVATGAAVRRIDLTY